MKIQTSNFSAEYGRSTGAAFNLLTKNGTNDFHGGAFEYFRNNALDARNFFSPDSTANNLTDFVQSLYNPAQTVTVNASGQVVPGSGNIYNGLERVANGVPKNQSWLVPNAYSPAVLSVPTGAPRGEYGTQATWQPRVGFAYALND